MSKVTTHVLDTARGKPAPGVEVVLERGGAGGVWIRVGSARTDANGRITEFPGAGELMGGPHRLRFDVGAYFGGLKVEPFFSAIEIAFEVRKPSEHHHVPLLLSPFGYTTYRGS